MNKTRLNKRIRNILLALSPLAVVVLFFTLTKPVAETDGYDVMLHASEGAVVTGIENQQKLISGENVEFIVSAENEYELLDISIVDDNGSPVTFTNESGTIKYIMPQNNVVVDIKAAIPLTEGVYIANYQPQTVVYGYTENPTATVEVINKSEHFVILSESLLQDGTYYSCDTSDVKDVVINAQTTKELQVVLQAGLGAGTYTDCMDMSFQVFDDELKEMKQVSMLFNITSDVAKQVVEKLEIPQIEQITYGQQLSEAEIYQETPELGTYKWMSPDIYPAAVDASYPMEFIPVDVVNYDYTKLEEYKEDGSIVVNQSIQVNKALLTVKLPDKQIEAGKKLPHVGISEYVYSGFVCGDTKADVVITGARDIEYQVTTSTAGTYRTGNYPELSSINYSFVFEDGTLTIIGDSQIATTAPVKEESSTTSVSEVTTEFTVTQEAAIASESTVTHEAIQNQELTAADKHSQLSSEIIDLELSNSFLLTIDPYRINQKEQIFSDDLNYLNSSTCPVRIQFNEIDVRINGIEQSDSVKDCKLYLNIGDGSRYTLQPGINKNVCEFQLGSDGETDSEQYIFITGEVSEGSEKLWVDHDITIHISFKVIPVANS